MGRETGARDMEDRETILCILLVLPALFAGGLLWIQYLDLKTLRWRWTNGRIVSARVSARDDRHVDRNTYSVGSVTTSSASMERLERRNFVSVEYEFKVDGKAYRGDRIDLGVKSDEDDVVEKARRYPAGKIVPVLYDPRDPSRCILERTPMRTILGGWLVVLLFVALIFGGVYGVGWIAGAVRAAIARPDAAPFAVAFGCFALVLALFGVAMTHKAREMSRWPQVDGEIVESAVATSMRVATSRSAASRLETKMYAPRVVYRYEVGADAFQGDDVGSVSYSSSPKGATRAIARYPVGGRVKVFVNPENSAESTIAPRVGWLPLIFWLPAAAFALAALAIALYAPPP